MGRVSGKALGLSVMNPVGLDLGLERKDLIRIWRTFWILGFCKSTVLLALFGIWSYWF